MTSLLSALPFTFTTGVRARTAQPVSDMEYQSVFAAAAILLAGGAVLCLTALTHAS